MVTTCNQQLLLLLALSYHGRMDFFRCFIDTPYIWIELFFILSGSLIAALFSRQILGRLRDLKEDHLYLRALGLALYKPLFWMILIFGGLLVLETLFKHADETQYSHLIRLKKIFFVAAAAVLLILWKEQLVSILFKRAEKSASPKSDKSLIAVSSKLIAVFVIVIAAYMILDILGVPLQALLAFGGLGSLAVSWAAKDVIANFFGGAMIYINRPFLVGDWIKSPNKNFEGVVEQIGWYMTRIRTFDRRPTFIPNAIMTDAIVENPGQMYNRRIKTTIGLRYDDIHHVKTIVDKIEQMLKTHPDIDQNQFLMVHFVEFNAYSLDINIYCFTKTTRWALFRTIQQDVLLRIAAIIESCGAQVAFPTRTVHVDSGNM